MSGQSTSTLSALLKPTVEPSPVDLCFRETDFLNLLRIAGRISPTAGAAPFSWNVMTSVNASTEVFTEGQAPPQAGKQTYVQTSLSPFYVRGVCGRTGHQRDNEARNGYYAPVQITESMLLEADVMKALEDQLVGSTQDRGYAAIVDSTGTYANLAQGTYSAWASQEDAVNGSLTVAVIEDLYEELTSASQSSVPRGANPTHITMPVNQITNYGRLQGFGNATATAMRIMGGQLYDLGVLAAGMAWNGMPIARVRGQTSTEVYMLDMTDFELLIHRDLEASPIIGNPEMESIQLSTAVCLKVRKRNKHGKATGVTA